MHEYAQELITQRKIEDRVGFANDSEIEKKNLAGMISNSSFYLNRILGQYLEEPELNHRIQDFANEIKTWENKPEKPYSWQKLTAFILSFPEHTHFQQGGCEGCGKELVASQGIEP